MSSIAKRGQRGKRPSENVINHRLHPDCAPRRNFLIEERYCSRIVFCAGLLGIAKSGEKFIAVSFPNLFLPKTGQAFLQFSPAVAEFSLPAENFYTNLLRQKVPSQLDRPVHLLGKRPEAEDSFGSGAFDNLPRPFEKDVPMPDIPGKQ